jgi:hypothetical protein
VPRRLAFVALALGACVVSACGGSGSHGGQAAKAASQAKAACDVFASFPSASGSGPGAQVRYARASARAFHRSAALARTAAGADSRWAALAAAAQREASAFDVIVKAATSGITLAQQEQVVKAVSVTKTARVLFIAQCAKADPAKFAHLTTSSPAPTLTGPTRQAMALRAATLSTRP